jgi:hypothetical protein
MLNDFPHTTNTRTLLYTFTHGDTKTMIISRVDVSIAEWIKIIEEERNNRRRDKTIVRQALIKQLLFCMCLHKTTRHTQDGKNEGVESEDKTKQKVYFF